MKSVRAEAYHLTPCAKRVWLRETTAKGLATPKLVNWNMRISPSIVVWCSQPFYMRLSKKEAHIKGQLRQTNAIVYTCHIKTTCPYRVSTQLFLNLSYNFVNQTCKPFLRCGAY